MVDLMYCLTNLLFFDISLLYYYSNHNSSIICCLFSGDIYLSFGFSNSFLFCENVFDTLVILSAILLPIKIASVCKFLSTIKQFLAIFIAHFF